MSEHTVDLKDKDGTAWSFTEESYDTAKYEADIMKGIGCEIIRIYEGNPDHQKSKKIRSVK